MTQQTEEIPAQVWRWRECQEELAAAWQREEPSEPEVGDGWYDEESNSICIWNGVEWVSIPAD